LLDIGRNGPLTADYQACADERQEVFMKAYISIALVVPLFALCAACAEAPYASETRASKTARPASPALPARKPAIALADPPASAAVFIPSEARRQPSDAADAAPSPPSGDGIPAASLSTMPSIAADSLKTEAAPQ